MKNEVDMLRKFILVSLSTVAFYSCGGSTTDSGGGSNTHSSVTFANPGPTSCLASSLSSGKFIPSYYQNFQEALLSPFKVKAMNIAQVPKLKRNLSQNNLKIVGGNTVATQSITNCSATNDDGSKQAYTVTHTNTVAIVNVNAGTVCSGTLVGDGTTPLVLTAAHCFNEITDFTSQNAEGLRVYFEDNFCTSYDSHGNCVLDSSNYSTVSCWQRNPYYQNSLTIESASLFDIAWIKLSSAPLNGYNIVKTVSTTTQSNLLPTDEKLMAGFGRISDSSGVDGNKRCVSTNSDSNYYPNNGHLGRGDIIPNGAATSFNSVATAQLASHISSFPTNAYEKFLTVIGPINGNTPKGSCNGDSGGPVYIYNAGTWVLYALTEGSSPALSPHPKFDFTGDFAPGTLASTLNFDADAASCDDGYGVYTTVGNYAGASDWIKTSSGIQIQTQ